MATDLPQLFANRYRIDGLIAEGGMARVYQGTDTVLGRTVAIKVLSASLATDPAFVARFEREAQSVASLNHPNLVGVYDIGSEGGFHYIVMEYVEGSTLDAVIRQNAPLDPDLVASIAASVCEGLGAAHKKGIVHRDIKPANIMIEPAGRVKVMDFGIAKTSSEGLTQVGAVLGTVKYLAPEQAYGRAIDERTDIYALGAVMYEMLTGRPPTSGETLMEIAHNLETEQPLPPSMLNPQVPAYLDRITMTALAKDPEDRYPSTADMALDLRGGLPGAVPGVAAAAAVTSSPTVVQAAGDRTRVMQPVPVEAPPRRLGLLVAAILLLVGGAYFVFANLLADDSPPVVHSPTPPVVTSAPASPTPSPTPTPTESPTPSPSPSPSPTPSETPDEEETVPAVDPAVRSAAGNIQGLVNAGIASGSISERAGRNVIDEVQKILSEAEKGDLEDAVSDVEDAREEVAKYVEREELSAQDAAAINAQLNRMAAALG
ncbi:MAG TPA: protein kinase [Actinomycetota bacterium]|nr:protein kinase [Actinomycetota bacterium]